MNQRTKQYWDLVGDIHGERDTLDRLLVELGYREDEGRFHHPDDRKLLFLGDFIDRGPDSRGVLHLVRRLMDEGIARAIMGNHEFNFISYHTEDGEGGYLRPQTSSNREQVKKTLESFVGHEEEIPDWIKWMKSLPFFLDLGDLRAVHASWVPEDIAYLAEHSLHDDEFLKATARRQDRAWWAIERVLKGAELPMPEGVSYHDADGTVRRKMRVRWWGQLTGLTWKEIAFPKPTALPDSAAELGDLGEILSYGPEEPPVFFGHYKLVNQEPSPQAPNVATLDYGLGHGGPATAYRWSGERVITTEHYRQVR